MASIETWERGEFDNTFAFPGMLQAHMHTFIVHEWACGGLWTRELIDAVHMHSASQIVEPHAVREYARAAGERYLTQFVDGRDANNSPLVALTLADNVAWDRTLKSAAAQCVIERLGHATAPVALIVTAENSNGTENATAAIAPNSWRTHFEEPANGDDRVRFRFAVPWAGVVRGDGGDDSGAVTPRDALAVLRDYTRNPFMATHAVYLSLCAFCKWRGSVFRAIEMYTVRRAPRTKILRIASISSSNSSSSSTNSFSGSNTMPLALQQTNSNFTCASLCSGDAIHSLMNCTYDGSASAVTLVPLESDAVNAAYDAAASTLIGDEHSVYDILDLVCEQSPLLCIEIGFELLFIE